MDPYLGTFSGPYLSFDARCRQDTSPRKMGVYFKLGNSKYVCDSSAKIFGSSIVVMIEQRKSSGTGETVTDS